MDFGLFEGKLKTMKNHQIIVAGLACLISYSASAQERPSSSAEQQKPDQRPVSSNGWTFTIGGGALLSPNYLGDDAYNLSVVPYIRVTKGERFTASVQEGLKYAAFKGENFRAGPRVSLEFGREEDGGSPFRIAGDRTNDLLGLGDVDPSLSLGGFAELDIGNLTASANLEQAVTGHKGLTGGIAVNYKGIIRRNGPPIIYTLGPRLDFADDKYQNAYFGVNVPQSTASGLAEFNAAGGVASYGASLAVIFPVTDNVATTFIGNYTRLLGDAASSPLVKERGSRDQGFIGLVTTYSF